MNVSVQGNCLKLQGDPKEQEKDGNSPCCLCQKLNRHLKCFYNRCWSAASWCKECTVCQVGRVWQINSSIYVSYPLCDILSQLSTVLEQKVHLLVSLLLCVVWRLLISHSRSRVWSPAAPKRLEAIARQFCFRCVQCQISKKGSQRHRLWAIQCQKWWAAVVNQSLCTVRVKQMANFSTFCIMRNVLF